MKIIPYPLPVKPVPTRYTLELDAEEFHDLQVVAGIKYDAMSTALKTSTGPRASENTQTHDVYGLLADIAEYQP